jgi:hypothetical protein
MYRKYAILAGLVLASSYQLRSADQNHADLSKNTRDKIIQKMNTDSDGHQSSLFVFDHGGRLEKQIPFPNSDVGKYKSLDDYLKSTGKPKPTPISSCEEPKPTSPPPQCVICKSGQVICSDAKKDKGEVQVFKMDDK